MESDDRAWKEEKKEKVETRERDSVQFREVRLKRWKMGVENVTKNWREWHVDIRERLHKGETMGKKTKIKFTNILKIKKTKILKDKTTEMKST